MRRCARRWPIRSPGVGSVGSGWRIRCRIPPHWSRSLVGAARIPDQLHRVTLELRRELPFCTLLLVSHADILSTQVSGCMGEVHPCRSSRGASTLRRPAGVAMTLEPAQNLVVRYTERLAEAGIEPSVGSVGDSFETRCQDHHRAVQDRGHPSARPLAQQRRRRVRPPRMGRLGPTTGGCSNPSG